MLFYYSTASSSFPDPWKLANAHAIHKKGSQADVSNYRPISLLSIPRKLLQSQICSLIDNHLNSCGTKSCKQWGFKKGLSTEGMLISMTEKWKMAIDHGRTVGAVFIDFQKAFDTVPHYILSYMLHAICIAGSVHEWLMSYQSNRRQFTDVNNCRSTTYLVHYGVPQGSLVGPTVSPETIYPLGRGKTSSSPKGSAANSPRWDKFLNLVLDRRDRMPRQARRGIPR